MGRTTLYTLEVILTDGPMPYEFAEANPLISRTIEIPADGTLDELHRAILVAFGRHGGDRPHEFRLGEPPRSWHAGQAETSPTCDDPTDPGEPDGEPVPESVMSARIGRLGLQVGQLAGYWYELGDNWYHEIRVSGIREAATGVEYPRVVSRAGIDPPPPVDRGDGDAGVLRRKQVETGLTELVDGSVVEWRHEVLSPLEASLLQGWAACRTHRVTSLRELPDGQVLVSTHLVPGDRLDPLLQAIHAGGEPETVLSVEVV